MKFAYKLIDLTHTLHEDVPSWGGGCGFKHDIKLDYKDCDEAVKFKVGQIKMHAGIGTHMDAPSHCIQGGLHIHEILVENLLFPCVVIDVSKHAHENYYVSIQDIEIFEKTYGSIPNNACVMIKTGWGRFWNSPQKYRNNLVFPSISMDAANYLLEKDVSALGVDTLSPDLPQDGHPVHYAFLKRGKIILENVAHLDDMPLSGGFIMALPIKVKDATESPVRLVGMIK